MTPRAASIRRIVAASAIVAAASILGAGTASAGHGHSKTVGTGDCVLLAQDSGESEVVLPFATDAQVDADRAHPLHLLVHLGEPGGNFAIGVAGTPTDPCYTSGDYVND